ncbi:unnamed protein product [Miscanthus lutarioriparius]|uniref:t-SNARE coiled-coil homology domain-containing protein n=1 Tax=Miscanthus lutarioriparius TaxID=422564 RepID=A0A811RIY7_9POAL|nr:unnamed protein product [Miscanthus lutarioriparius]
MRNLLTVCTAAVLASCCLCVSLACGFPSSLLVSRMGSWFAFALKIKAVRDSFELGKREQAPGNVDIELGLQGDLTSSAQPGFEGFYEQVKEIENLLNTLTKLLKDLQNSNEESKVVTKASAMKEVKKRMEKDVNEVTKIARLAKSKAEQLNKDNAANREKPGFGKGSGVDRSRTTTTVALTKKLRERILEFQTLREEIQKEYRDVVERRVFTVTGERADEETIDKLIETGDGEQIFQRAIQEQGRGRVLDTLQEIQERHDTVKEIERKLLDLQQIFLDLAVLVEAHGEMLDNIETQVTGAVEHIQTGTNLLQKAKKLQKNSRKWTCIGIIILLIIILIVILSLKPWSWGLYLLVSWEIDNTEAVVSEQAEGRISCIIALTILLILANKRKLLDLQQVSRTPLFIPVQGEMLDNIEMW